MALKLIEVLATGWQRLVDVAIDATAITSGTIDPARLPPSGGVIVASGDITSLTPAQQALIVEGTEVILTNSGFAYVYKGSGSKTSLSSYVQITSSVGWSAITGKPDPVTAIGTVTAASDTFAYFTGVATAAVASITSFGRSLFAAADAAAARTLLACLPSASPVWSGEMSGTLLSLGSYLIRAGDSTVPTADGDVVLCYASRIRGYVQFRWNASNREETVFAYIAAGQFDATGASIQILGRYSYNVQQSLSGLKLMLSADAATVYLVATLGNRNSGLNPVRVMYSGTDPVAFGGAMPVGGSTIKSITLAADGIRGSSLGAQDLAGTGVRPASVDANGKLVPGAAVQNIGTNFTMGNTVARCIHLTNTTNDQIVTLSGATASDSWFMLNESAVALSVPSGSVLHVGAGGTITGPTNYTWNALRPMTLVYMGSNIWSIHGNF